MYFFQTAVHVPTPVAPTTPAIHITLTPKPHWPKEGRRVGRETRRLLCLESQADLKPCFDDNQSRWLLSLCFVVCSPCELGWVCVYVCMFNLSRGWFYHSWCRPAITVHFYCDVSGCAACTWSRMTSSTLWLPSFHQQLIHKLKRREKV